MSETCDRCGPAVRAVYRVDGQGELYLCGHCTSLLRQALSAQGWTIRPVPLNAGPARAGADRGYGLNRDHGADFGRSRPLPFGQVDPALGGLTRDGKVGGRPEATYAGV